MDQPLFGEEERKWKFLSWAGIVFVIGGVGFSILILIIQGARNGVVQHYFATGIVAIVFASHVLLYRWYQQGDLDPKFKWLLILSIVSTLYVCLVANIYAWRPNPIIPGADCNYLYDKTSGGCIYIQDYNQCLNVSNLNDYCIKMRPGNPPSGYCHNCTITPPAKPMPPLGNEHAKLFN